jgi:hypothetical protein
MLVDEHYRNVLSLLRELVECLLYCRLLRLVVDDEEISLRVWRLCDMSNAGEEESCDRADKCQDLVPPSVRGIKREVAGSSLFVANDRDELPVLK